METVFAAMLRLNNDGQFPCLSMSNDYWLLTISVGNHFENISSKDENAESKLKSIVIDGFDPERGLA